MAAADRLLDLADRVLGDDFKLSGVPQEKLFAEMVQACNRKYNLRLNKSEGTPGASISPLQNPYYRGKQGMPDLDR